MSINMTDVEWDDEIAALDDMIELAISMDQLCYADELIKIKSQHERKRSKQ